MTTQSHDTPGEEAKHGLNIREFLAMQENTPPDIETAISKNLFDLMDTTPVPTPSPSPEAVAKSGVTLESMVAAEEINAEIGRLRGYPNTQYLPLQVIASLVERHFAPLREELFEARAQSARDAETIQSMVSRQVIDAQVAINVQGELMRNNDRLRTLLAYAENALYDINAKLAHARPRLPGNNLNLNPTQQ